MDKHKLQGLINKWVNKINSKKIYSLDDGEIGINLGCDVSTVPSFVGVDGSFLIYLMKNKFLPRNIKKRLYNQTYSSKKYSFEDFMKKISEIKIIHHDLSYGIPFKNSSVEFVFTSHFLEHLDELRVNMVLNECFRVLKIHGKIRIVVPDLEDYLKEIEEKIKQYKKDKKIQPFQEYLTSENHVYSEFGFHKRIYNFEELKRILIIAGFKNIYKMKKHEGDFPNLKLLELRGGLIVQAEK